MSGQQHQHNGADTHQVSVVAGAHWQPPVCLRVVTHTRFACTCGNVEMSHKEQKTDASHSTILA